jgi:transcriptional regulator with XRE-family HTH domain
MHDQKQRQALAAFLRDRREQIQPTQLGLPSSRRRRTPGLRREEVAWLANISSAWYTSLEQGREVHPSRDILESLAGALQLTPDERGYLFFLAGEGMIADPPPEIRKEEINPLLQDIVNDLYPKPAYILGQNWNYLVTNAAAEAVFSISKGIDPYRDNIMWQLFADPAMRSFFVNWELLARKVLALFRAEIIHFAEDPYLKKLIDDLQQASEDFRCWWTRHEVCNTFECHKEIRHALVGDMTFEHLTLHVPSSPTLKLMVYQPCQDNNTEGKLKQLLHI